MALSKITCIDKTALQENLTITDANKITASDMNEIKTVLGCMCSKKNRVVQGGSYGIH